MPAAAPIRLGHQRLDLGGAPAALFSVDLDRDGRRDLALVVASTEWGQIGIEEMQQVDELGAYVEVLTVVPALFDRRELVVHLGIAAGRFAAEPVRLELAGERPRALRRPAGDATARLDGRGHRRDRAARRRARPDADDPGVLADRGEPDVSL